MDRSIMEVLIQGLEFTNQLHLHLLQNKNNFLFGDEDFKESALDLTTKIHQSFTSALSLLNTCSANNSVDDGTSCDELFIDYEILSSGPVMTTGMSSNGHHWKNTDQYFGESKNKGIPGSSANRDDLKVGCKRRKQSNSTHTWVRVTPTVIDDGHAWRKYGQKPIYNTKFPRTYYRCTHRKEQGCRATKHVQKTQDKPSMFQTTYMGYHTCKETASILNAIPNLMLDESADPSDHSSCVINFQTNLAIKKPFTFPSSSLNISVTEHEHNTTSHDQYNITPSDHDLSILLADLTAFESISREVHEVLGV